MLKIVLLPVLLVMTESDESFTVFIIPCHSCLDYETRPRCTLSFDIYYLTSDNSLDFILLQNVSADFDRHLFIKGKVNRFQTCNAQRPRRRNPPLLCREGDFIPHHASLEPSTLCPNTHVTKPGRLACGLNVRDSGSLGVTSAVFALLCLHCCVY